MTSTDRLDVWLHDQPVAIAERARRDRIRLTYTGAALERYAVNTPVLSCSLLLGSRSFDATAFVDGLLPEGHQRRAFAERARVPAHDSFGLIARYGRDIAGAVQFMVPGADHSAARDWDTEALDAAQLADAVAGLPDNPLGLTDDSELSLAGLQNKMLLMRHSDGTWARPLHGHPSTHILKRDSDRHPGLVAAECDALAVARHAGLTSVSAWIERHADTDCLIVERFDRVRDDQGAVVARVHQEDACQALGLPSTQKYEVHHGGGGPSLRQVARLLDLHAADPSSELDRLVELAVFTVIIGNADAHGKNVAFLFDEGGTIRLAPAYDTVPTILWPTLRREMAMSLGGALTDGALDLAALYRETKAWRHSASATASAADRCARAMLDAVDQGVIDPGGKLARRITTAAPRFVS